MLAEALREMREHPNLNADGKQVSNTTTPKP